MSRRTPPKQQPNPALISTFLDNAIKIHHRHMEENPAAHPTFIATVALKAKEARVPLMRLREIANNTKNPQAWRHVATYIIDTCRV